MSYLAMPSTREGRFHPIRFALRARIPLVWATMVAAVIGLFASLAPIHALLSPVFGAGATHPLTALCLVGLGGSILRSKRFGRSSRTRIGLLGVVLAICTMRLMASALVAFAGVAAIPAFGPVAGFIGTFSLEIAIALGAFAVAGLMRQGSGRWGPAFLLVGLAIVFNMMLGVGFAQGPGAFTMLGLVGAAAAMMSMFLHSPFIRVAFLIGDIGSQTRVMAATVVAIPISAAVVLGQFGPSGGLAPIHVAMLTTVCFSMLIILLGTSAHHEGSVATRRRAERDIAMRSRTDELTGALNRFGMNEVVEGAWVEFRSAGAQFGMILLDLDYFRCLDATFGHDDGEAVLGRVAQTVQAQLRGLDALGRWDKDEFMVLLKIKDYSNIAIVADRIRSALVSAENPFCAGLAMEPARIDIALGTAAFLEGDDSANMAIIRADLELNDVKTTATKMMADLEEDTPFDILTAPDIETEVKTEGTAAAA